MKKRFYALFELIDGKWQIVSQSAYHKETAVRIFQNRLLEPFFSGGNKRELRPITDRQLADLRSKLPTY